ncbi:MAG: trypsin-like peptidase domain-containing protein [Acidimicrobiia bacterium]
MGNDTADNAEFHRPPPPPVDDEVRVRPIEPPATPPLFPYAPFRPEPGTTPEPGRNRWLGPVLGAIAGAAILASILWGTGRLDRPTTTTAEAGVIREVVTEGDRASATAVARKVVPSIVTVDVGTGADDSFELLGSGSGVVLTNDGLIVTNHHVVVDMDTYRVIFSDGRIYGATLVGSDRRTDLAVLRISATDLTPIEIGSTKTASIGDTAIAVGSPLGLEGGPSVTVGVVSAFGRQVRTGSTSVDVLFDMLQTDAPITQGSSGGALVDANGKLLGITSAIGVSAAGAEGVGFAIPVELMSRITGEIIETGTVQHPFIGVSLGTAFSENPDGSQRPAGAYVTDFPVEPAAARDAGVEIDDIIVAYDGTPVRIPDDLISGLRGYRVGDTVTLSVERGSDHLEIPVVLGIRPDDI